MDILSTFTSDERIVLWDLYNEPGNSGYGNKSMELLKNAFEWGWKVRPSQPLSVGVWSLSLPDLKKFHRINEVNILAEQTYRNITIHYENNK